MTQPYPLAREIAGALEAWADLSYAESYDNTGLHVGRPDRRVACALVALDLTPKVIAEADRIGADMILTHHPLLFRPPKHILASELQGRMILELARLDITLYSIHTNLDSVTGGVSFDLARRLGLADIRFLIPKEEAGSGLGACGELAESLTLEAFLQQLTNSLNARSVRYTGDDQAPVKTVAVCGGAGSSLIAAALKAGADAYVTADISYHCFFDVLGAGGQPMMALIDAGHYETERHTEELLCDWLAERFPEVRFIQTETRTSPVRTFIR
ncbi:MAG: Nif3-like dinuclear metal center hexameric protein [Bacteroidota bacterium]|nr:Nif3-like dinuclear metal center hexameric protein [Bacteroidota bacterium]